MPNLLENTLRTKRLRAGWGQKALAENVGVSRQTIHSIETGKYIPSLLIGLRIAHCLEVPVTDIFKIDPHWRKRRWKALNR